MATETSSMFLVSCNAKTTRDKSEEAAFRAIARLTPLVSVKDTQQQLFVTEHVNSFRSKLVYTETILIYSFVLYTLLYKLDRTENLGKHRLPSGNICAPFRLFQLRKSWAFTLNI